MNEYIKRIQDIKLHLKGVGYTILETNLVERMFGTLLTNYDPVYQQVSGLTVMPTFDYFITLARNVTPVSAIFIRDSTKPCRHSCSTVPMESSDSRAVQPRLHLRCTGI
jgi:hypothetical protein